MFNTLPLQAYIRRYTCVKTCIYGYPFHSAFILKICILEASKVIKLNYTYYFSLKLLFFVVFQFGVKSSLQVTHNPNGLTQHLHFECFGGVDKDQTS